MATGRARRAGAAAGQSPSAPSSGTRSRRAACDNPAVTTPPRRPIQRPGPGRRSWQYEVGSPACNPGRGSDHRGGPDRRPRRGRRPSGPLAVLLLVVSLALLGCGSNPPSTSPAPATSQPSRTLAPSVGPTPAPTATPDAAAVYATIQQQVEQIRGLQPRRAITPTLLDEAALHQLVVASFDKANPSGQLQAEQELLQHLGLLPGSASLVDLETQFLSGEVVGLYDPETRKLYVVSQAGQLGPTERVTYAHEFTHELQDQNFGLQDLGLDQPDQGDRALARSALVEGDATLVMQLWETEHLTAAEIGQVAGLGDLLGQLALLARMPAILVQDSLFPYTAGLQFVTALRAQGGWAAVNAAFRDPPDSTSQILHPERYLAHQRPLAVSLPAGLPAELGSGWSLPLQDTLGELQLRIWLGSQGTTADAAGVAAGWRGDRVGLYRGPDGAWAVVIATAWASPSAAAAFRDAADGVLAKLPVGTTVAGAAGPVVALASDPTVLGQVVARL